MKTLYHAENFIAGVLQNNVFDFLFLVSLPLVASEYKWYLNNKISKEARFPHPFVVENISLCKAL